LKIRRVKAARAAASQKKRGRVACRSSSGSRRRARKARKKIVRRGRFFVYIVQCADGAYYTGYTRDLAARLKLHNSGRGSKYVRSRRPVTLVFFKKYRYYKHAVIEELRIKALTRKQKERMVHGRPVLPKDGF
jgi:putative endonuclease